MKYLFALGLLSVITFSSTAQSKDQRNVSMAVEKLRKAMIDGDRIALEAVASDNLSYGHSGGKVENKSEFVEAIEEDDARCARDLRRHDERRSRLSLRLAIHME